MATVRIASVGLNSAGKGTEKFRWNPPSLPDWALPPAEPRQGELLAIEGGLLLMGALAALRAESWIRPLPHRWLAGFCEGSLPNRLQTRVARHLDGKGYEATTGVGPDLMEGARSAVIQMVDLVAARYGLSPVDAYMLCSVCADLRISEIVDMPNWVVSFYLPRVVFE